MNQNYQVIYTRGNEPELSDSDRYELRRLEETLDPSRIDRPAKRERNIKIGAFSALFGVLGLAITLAYRTPSEGAAWDRLNDMPPIACKAEASHCENIDDILEKNSQTIEQAAERAGIEAKELRALVRASYLNPFRSEREAKGYIGIVLQMPEEAGVPAHRLDDIEQNIYSAADRYAHILRSTSHPEDAVALFFGNEPDIEQAKGLALNEHMRCHGDGMGSGACGVLENHRQYRGQLDEWEQRIADAPEEEKSRLQDDFKRWKHNMEANGRHYLIRDQDIAWFEDFERRTLWYNDLNDGYTREAIQLFYSALGND